MPLGTPPKGPAPPSPGRAAISALDVLGVTFTIIVLTLFGAVMLGQILSLFTANKAILQLALYAIHPLALLGAVYALMIRTGRYQWRDLGMVPATARWNRIGLLAGIGMVPLVYLVVQIAHQVIGGDAPQGTQITHPTPGSLLFWANFVTLFLYIGILIPIAEELFFRGVVFGRLRSRFDFWPANIATALAFGLIHMQSVEISLALMAGGIVLGWLYERSNSLVPSILAHQAFNTVGVVMLLFAALAK